ncbi:hypothetical protein [Dactylosporangium cerinum]
MGTVDEVRGVALSLPRTTEHLIRDRVKFRVGSIVYLALSQDETTLGFAFPRRSAPRSSRPTPPGSSSRRCPTCGSTGSAGTWHTSAATSCAT